MNTFGSSMDASRPEATKAAFGLKAAATSCAVLGICGELAETVQGNGSFQVNLMDKLSTLTEVELEEHFCWEDVDTNELKKNIDGRMTDIEELGHDPVFHH